MAVTVPVAGPAPTVSAGGPSRRGVQSAATALVLLALLALLGETFMLTRRAMRWRATHV